MALRLYFDKMSQPSRAVLMFVRINGIPCEEIPVALRKGEHLTPEFEKITRFRRVPAIDHNGFKLAESQAIFRYLARSFPNQVKPNWYPTDLVRESRVDEFLSWQHIGLRAWASIYFREKLINPLFLGRETNEQMVKMSLKGLQGSLKELENIWLKELPYVAGKEISVADLLAVAELEQPGMAGFDVTDGFPKIEAYMKRVKAETQPHYDDAHEIVYKTKQKLAATVQ